MSIEKCSFEKKTLGILFNIAEVQNIAWLGHNYGIKFKPVIQVCVMQLTWVDSFTDEQRCIEELAKYLSFHEDLTVIWRRKQEICRLHKRLCSAVKFSLNLLSANPSKWSNTLKQFIGKLPTNCLSVFDHFVKLAPKGLKRW